MKKHPLQFHEIFQLAVSLAIAVISAVELMNRPKRFVAMVSFAASIILAVVAIGAIVLRRRRFNRKETKNRSE